MTSRIAAICLLLVLIGLGIFFNALDDRYNAQMPDKRQAEKQTERLLEQHLNAKYTVHFVQRLDDEFVGAAAADGSTRTVIARVKDHDIVRIDMVRSDGLVDPLSWAQPKSYTETHPRLWLYLYAISSCSLAYSALYFLLGALRGKPQSASRRWWLGLIALLCCGLVALIVYGLVTTLQQWLQE